MHLKDWGMKSNFKRIGNYLQLVDERNTGLKITRLLGINITKNFMASVANTSGVDLSRYKTVKKDRFACNIMHVGRDEKLPIALYAEDEPAIVSPAYMTFEAVSYTHLRAHETVLDLVCRLLLEKKKTKNQYAIDNILTSQ